MRTRSTILHALEANHKIEALKNKDLDQKIDCFLLQAY